MEVETWKRFPAFAVAEILFDVKQNRRRKELCIVPHPGRENKKTVDVGRGPNNGNHAFLVSIVCAFSVGRVVLDGFQAEP
jgi:hypothetical protein